jgi:hypothetical protein
MALDGADDGLSSPVFVDPSGRRQRVLRRLGWVLATLIALYLAVMVVSLVASPSLLRLSLPGLGTLFPGSDAPRLSDGESHLRSPGQALSATSPRLPARSGPGGGGAAPGASPSATGVGHLKNTPTAGPTPRPSPSVSRTPSPTPSPTVTPSPTPQVTTPPPKRHGKPTAHPTPHGTGKPTAKPTHTHTPNPRKT